MTIHVGQKVVCVDDRSNAWTRQWINRGRVYEVIGVIPKTWDIENLFPNEPIDLVLAGVLKRGGFSAARFRPIVEKKTDISFAHEILRKVARKQTVRA